MHLITKNLPGNVHESAAYLNKIGVAKFVLSIDFNGGNYSTGLLRTEDYQDYLYLCEKFKDTPKTVDEYYG